jgi:hypothetical protein
MTTIKRYSNVQASFANQNKLNHTEFFRKYLNSVLDSVPESENRKALTRGIAKDIKDTQVFFKNDYNRIVNELSHVLKHKSNKPLKAKKNKGPVYIVKVQLYRELNQEELKKIKLSEENNAPPPFKYETYTEQISQATFTRLCRVGCTVNFQVQTKEDIKQYENQLYHSKEYPFNFLNYNVLFQNPEYKRKFVQCESWILAMKMTVLETLEKATQIDLYDFEVYKSMNGPLPKICNDYTVYKGETLNDVINSDVLTKYLMSSFKEHACFYTAIINAYPSLKLRIGSTRGSAEMNYDNLKKYFISKGVEVSDDFGLTVNQALVFFKDYKINFTAINIKNQVITTHKEESINKKVSNSHFQCMIHNSHIYTLNNQLKAVKEEQGELRVSTNYRLQQQTKYDYVIDTSEELLNLRIPSDVKYCILYTGDMDDLLLYMINVMKYEPKAQVENGHVKSICYSINNSWITIKYCQTDNDEVVNLHLSPIEERKSYAEAYIKCNELMKSTLLSYQNRSDYNEFLLLNLINNPFGPICGSFEEGEFNKVHSVDFSLAYSSILKSLPFIPVLKQFDNFEKYNDEPIVDHYMYNVEFTSSDKLDMLYSEKSERITYGYNLKHYNKDHYDILTVCKVSQKNANTLTSVINEIWSDKVLTTQDKKMIFNVSIGCCGKLKNNVHRSLLFESQQEALKIASDVRQINVIEHMIDNPDYDPLSLDSEPKIKGDKSLYYVNEQASAYLQNGFYPITMLIYDTMRRKLYQLGQQLNKQGCNILGVRTDCIYVDKAIESVDGFKLTKTRDFNHITIKAGGTLPKKAISFVVEDEDEKADFILKTKPVVKVSHLDDENSSKAYDKFFNQNDQALITAILAGAGKTTSIIRYCNRKGLKLAIVCPYNELRIEFSSKFEGVDAYTVDSFFGLSIGDEKHRVVKASNYDVILFDEIFSYNTRHLAHVAQLLRDTKDVKIYATGDPLQNACIENITANKESYYVDIINGLFPKQLNLKHSKRLENKADETTLLNMKSFIFDNFNTMPREAFVSSLISKFNIKTCNGLQYKKGTINQCHTNETCKTLNQIYNDKEAKDYVQGRNYKWFPSMVVINKVRFKIQKDVFHVNTRYTIKDVNTKGVLFTDETEIPFETLETNFIPNHSFTCHSIQGKSFREAIEIHDIFDHFITPNWIWVSLTRATKLSNVSINLMKSTQSLSGYDFQKMINNHKEEDAKHDRLIDDFVNVEWINNQYNQQAGLCALCSHRINSKCESRDALNLSIDRLNNDVGHVKNNCQLTHVRCNIAKK